MPTTIDSYSAWCVAHGCTHGHCKFMCEHPQPFLVDGVLVCGRCAAVEGELVPMEPCTPENCE